MTKIISVRPPLRESETPAPKVFREFDLDQGLIFEAVGFRQNGGMKCFDADGETGRWFTRQFSATSVWLKVSATVKIKSFFKVIWKSSHGKSCALNAQDGFKTLITLLCMLANKRHEYPVDARKHFIRHPLKNYFAAGEMAVTDFRPCKTRGRRGGFPPVSLMVTVRSNRQPQIIFGRWPSTAFHQALPMPDFNETFDMKRPEKSLFSVFDSPAIASGKQKAHFSLCYQWFSLVVGWPNCSRKEKTLCSLYEQSLLEKQIKSVL